MADDRDRTDSGTGERPVDRLERLRPESEDRRSADQGALEQLGEGGRRRPLSRTPDDDGPETGATRPGTPAEDEKRRG